MRRIVFDEGHHLFDAADFAFRGHLTGAGGDRAAPLDRGPEAQGAARPRPRGPARRRRLRRRRKAEELLEPRARCRPRLARAAAGCARVAGRHARRRRPRPSCGGAPAGAMAATARRPRRARDRLPAAGPGLVEAAGRLAAALIDLKRPLSRSPSAWSSASTTRQPTLDPPTAARVEARRAARSAGAAS